MAYEVDFLRVGDRSKGGDAIAMRWGGNLGPYSGDQVVVVVDGGNKAAGEELVAHLKRFYGTRIDYLISSHPHDDHQTGLTVLLDDGDFDIGRLWMHLPWNHTSRASLQFRDGRVTPGSVSERLELSLNTAKDIQVSGRSAGHPNRGAVRGQVHFIRTGTALGSGPVRGVLRERAASTLRLNAGGRVWSGRVGEARSGRGYAKDQGDDQRGEAHGR